jgi:hypothetical protein
MGKGAWLRLGALALAGCVSARYTAAGPTQA